MFSAHEMTDELGGADVTQLWILLIKKPESFHWTGCLWRFRSGDYSWLAVITRGKSCGEAARQEGGAKGRWKGKVACRCRCGFQRGLRQSSTCSAPSRKEGKCAYVCACVYRVVCGLHLECMGSKPPPSVVLAMIFRRT